MPFPASAALERRYLGRVQRSIIRVVEIAEAKTHLAHLVEGAVTGEPFIIERDGKPLVKVVALGVSGPREKRRLGSLAGQITVPDDFNRMDVTENRRPVRSRGMTILI